MCIICTYHSTRCNQKNNRNDRSPVGERFCLPLFQQVQRRGNFLCRVRLRAVQDIRIAHCGLPHCGGSGPIGRTAPCLFRLSVLLADTICVPLRLLIVPDYGLVELFHT